MLTIEHCDREETLQVGELFRLLGFAVDAAPTDDTGDSCIANVWAIEVVSFDGFYPIEGFRWTKPERQVKLFHRAMWLPTLEDSVRCLECSPEHLVLRQGVLHPTWVKVSELVPGDLIVGQWGTRQVVEVQPIDDVARLCDMQVALAHSYYTSGVLSHNSHMLTFLGANALRNNVDVLHYTMELSEAAVGRRYDSNLCDIDSNDVIESKDAIISKYKQMKLGRLMIKEFPTATATIYTLRSHIERLDLKGFRPGLIIIDYADIMRSTRQYDSLRHELKLIYEELRGFAGEKLLPIWTACFHGDTVVSSPSGDFMIKDRVGQSGFPVYAYNHETKRLELRTAKSVYKSGDNVEVWRVTFDNAKSVIVTPNHKFMRRDGTYCELRDLHVGESLMPLEQRTEKGAMLVKIEPWGHADVYNMEIDELHNYALAAGVIAKNSQSNKEGATSEIVDLGNMSEAYGKAMVADVVLSISRKAHEKSEGYGRLFIAKNRAGRDGIVYPVKIDTARSKFEVTGTARGPEETAREDESGFKRALRERRDALRASQDKWKDVNNDPLLQKPGSGGSDEPSGSSE